MKNSKLALALFSVFLLLISITPVIAAERDQYQTKAQEDIDIYKGIVVQQSFKAGMTGELTKVRLKLRWETMYCANAFGSGSSFCEVRVKIRDDRGSQLGSTSEYDASYMGTSYRWYDFNINGVDVESGEVYWIQVTTRYYDSGGNGLRWGRTTYDAYPRGGYERYDERWIRSDYDLAFETYVDAPSCSATPGWKCRDSDTIGYQNSDCSWSSIQNCGSGEICMSGQCVSQEADMVLERLYMQDENFVTKTEFNKGDHIYLTAQSQNNGYTGDFTTKFYIFKGNTLKASYSRNDNAVAGTEPHVKWSYTIPSSWSEGTYSFEAKVSPCSSNCLKTMSFTVDSAPQQVCDAGYACKDDVTAAYLQEDCTWIWENDCTVEDRTEQEYFCHDNVVWSRSTSYSGGCVSGGCAVDMITGTMPVEYCNYSNAVCENGACVPLAPITCDVSFADCDNDPSNSCEINIMTDTSNCGGCGLACSFGEQCIMGTCTIPAGSCSSDLDCENYEVCDTGACRPLKFEDVMGEDIDYVILSVENLEYVQQNTDEEDWLGDVVSQTIFAFMEFVESNPTVSEFVSDPNDAWDTFDKYIILGGDQVVGAGSNIAFFLDDFVGYDRILIREVDDAGNVYLHYTRVGRTTNAIKPAQTIYSKGNLQKAKYVGAIFAFFDAGFAGWDQGSGGADSAGRFLVYGYYAAYQDYFMEPIMFGIELGAEVVTFFVGAAFPDDENILPFLRAFNQRMDSFDFVEEIMVPGFDDPHCGMLSGDYSLASPLVCMGEALVGIWDIVSKPIAQPADSVLSYVDGRNLEFSSRITNLWWFGGDTYVTAEVKQIGGWYEKDLGVEKITLGGNESTVVSFDWAMPSHLPYDGSYEVSFMVWKTFNGQSGEDLVFKDTFNFSLGVNNPPDILIFFCNSSVVQGEDVYCKGSAQDPEGDSIMFSLSKPDGFSLVDATLIGNNPLIVDYIYGTSGVEPGEHVLTLTASANGLYDQSEYTVEVLSPPMPPTPPIDQSQLQQIYETGNNKLGSESFVAIPPEGEQELPPEEEAPPEEELPPEEDLPPVEELPPEEELPTPEPNDVEPEDVFINPACDGTSQCVFVPEELYGSGNYKQSVGSSAGFGALLDSRDWN
jgi:hypothetical protein